MGLFSKQRSDFLGRRAYMAHVNGNRLYDAGKPNEAQPKHEQARQLYEQAFDQGCERVAYLMAYGVLMLRFREYDKARAAFLKAESNKALTKDERKQLRINFAIAQWKLGQLDSAIEQLEIAAQDGKNAMLYGSMGYILIEKAAQTGDFERALAFNREAYDYDEDDAIVLDNMGQLHLHMGMRDEALGYFRRAHERKPNQVDTLYYLAKLALEDGERDAALEYLSTALNGNFSALSTITLEQAQALLEEAEAVGAKKGDE